MFEVGLVIDDARFVQTDLQQEGKDWSIEQTWLKSRSYRNLGDVTWKK